MFLLTKDFILAKELTEMAGINISNISMLYEEMKKNNDAIKLGRDVFIRKNSINLIPSIKKYIQKYKYTDLTDSLPLTYFLNELSITKKDFTELKKIYKDDIHDFKVINKNFVLFSGKFKKILKENVLYTTNENGLKECEPYIDSFIKIGKKYILIY